MNKLIKQVLDLIVDELTNNQLQLLPQLDDGRFNSITNEKQISQFLLNNANLNNFLKQRQLKIIATKPREWFDVAIIGSNCFYPINIKSTNLKPKQNDNLNCKLGIYYALTGKKPTFANEINWKDFFNLLFDHLHSNNQDYYFLIVGKNNPPTVFWTSLKQLQTLVPSGNNLPFQASWFENQIRMTRDFTSAKDFLITHLEASIKKRAAIWDHWTNAIKKLR